MDIKVSVIIPIYNTCNFLEEAIESVLNQIYKNIEIILIDDGSKDGSEKICDKYAEKYNNIVAKHMINSGAAKARNEGIKLATGEFIMFFDSDDILASNAINDLLGKAVSTNADMVMPDRYFCIDENGEMLGTKFHFNKKLCIESPIDFALKVMMGAGRGWRTHSLLIKTSVIKDNNINFAESVVAGEDYIFNLNCMKVLKRLEYINVSTVYYRTRKNSITATFHKNYMENIWKLDAAAKNFISEMKIPEEIAAKYKDAIFIREVISYISDIFSKKIDLTWKERKIQARNIVSNNKVQARFKGYFKDVYFTNKFTILYYRIMRVLIIFKLYFWVYIVACIGGRYR